MFQKRVNEKVAFHPSDYVSKRGKAVNALLQIVVGVSLLAAASSSLPGQAPTLTVLHNFTGGADGGFPSRTPLAYDLSGNVYGTTQFGGNAACNCGVVYKLNVVTGIETVLHTFDGTLFDSGGSITSLVRGPSGSLFGTLAEGGNRFTSGQIYKIDPDGTKTVLYSFPPYNSSKPGYPEAGVVRDEEGNLYGTTTSGGNTSDCPNGCGIVYELSSSGTFSQLYAFTGGNGENSVLSESSLILDGAGNLYGTTVAGGIGDGSVFKLAPDGTETTLTSFPSFADGVGPSSGVIEDGAGNLYGVTSQGGLYYGVVYKLDASGTYTALYSFTGGADGWYPAGKLYLDALTGDLYGTTQYGGVQDATCSAAYPGCGVIFKVDPSGAETVVYAFPDASKGSNPASGLIGIRREDGTLDLFGTAPYGGTTVCAQNEFECGTAFKLSIPPSAPRELAR
jgi:uncharacterized repeat protein (TIGR03803 family)